MATENFLLIVYFTLTCVNTNYNRHSSNAAPFSNNMWLSNRTDIYRWPFLLTTRELNFPQTRVWTDYASCRKAANSFQYHTTNRGRMYRITLAYGWQISFKDKVVITIPITSLTKRIHIRSDDLPSYIQTIFVKLIILLL